MISQDNLLLYNHKHLIGSDESSEADQLLSIMFAHYDANGDGKINSQELAAVCLHQVYDIYLHLIIFE